MNIRFIVYWSRKKKSVVNPSDNPSPFSSIRTTMSWSHNWTALAIALQSEHLITSYRVSLPPTNFNSSSSFLKAVFWLTCTKTNRTFILTPIFKVFHFFLSTKTVNLYRLRTPRSTWCFKGSCKRHLMSDGTCWLLSKYQRYLSFKRMRNRFYLFNVLHYT